MATATRTMMEFKSRFTRSSSNPELELLESADSSPPEKSTLSRSASCDRAYAKTRDALNLETCDSELVTSFKYTLTSNDTHAKRLEFNYARVHMLVTTF